jgi:2-dehydropantoate 2-reductase
MDQSPFALDSDRRRAGYFLPAWGHYTGADAGRLEGKQTPMHEVHVVGAGGIGVAVGWALASAGWPVLLVETNRAKLESGRRDGIAIAGRGTLRPRVVAFGDWTPVESATVLLCTKTYDHAPVLARLPQLETLVPVQNGFEAALEQGDHPLEAIASFVSECAPDRPVTRITRAGALHLGPRRALTAASRTRLADLAAGLAAARLFAVVTVPAIQPYKAAKLMYSAAISPLAAAAGVDNGELLSDPLARRLFFALLRENYRILRQAGVALARIGPFHPDTVHRILRTPGLAWLLSHVFRPSLRGTYCSMAPDLPGGRTEVDAYNGYLVRVAGTTPCPLNRAVLALVRRLERERTLPHRDVWRELAHSLSQGGRA